MVGHNDSPRICVAISHQCVLVLGNHGSAVPTFLLGFGVWQASSLLSIKWYYPWAVNICRARRIVAVAHLARCELLEVTGKSRDEMRSDEWDTGRGDTGDPLFHPNIDDDQEGGSLQSKHGLNFHFGSRTDILWLLVGSL